MEFDLQPFFDTKSLMIMRVIEMVLRHKNRPHKRPQNGSERSQENSPFA